MPWEKRGGSGGGGTGPAGPQGPAGPAGPPGPAGSAITRLRDFHTNAPTSVVAGGTVPSGSYTFSYVLENPVPLQTVRLVGRQRTPSGTDAVAVTVPVTLTLIAGENLASFTFPTNGDFATVGNRYDLVLELYDVGLTPGTDTPTATETIEIRTEAAPSTARMYWDTQPSATPSTFDIASTTVQSQTQLTGRITFPAPSSEEGFFAIAYPDSAPPLVEVLFGSLDYLPNFTVAAGAIMVGGVPYTVAALARAQLGALLATVVR